MMCVSNWDRGLQQKKKLISINYMHAYVHRCHQALFTLFPCKIITKKLTIRTMSYFWWDIFPTAAMPSSATSKGHPKICKSRELSRRQVSSSSTSKTLGGMAQLGMTIFERWSVRLLSFEITSVIYCCCCCCCCSSFCCCIRCSCCCFCAKTRCCLAVGFVAGLGAGCFPTASPCFLVVNWLKGKVGSPKLGSWHILGCWKASWPKEDFGVK